MGRRADVTISHAPSFGNRFGLCCLYSNTAMSAPSLRFFYLQILPPLCVVLTTDLKTFVLTLTLYNQLRHFCILHHALTIQF